MNRLRAIDVFEEVKNSCATGQEFCLKLYQSHVMIQQRLPKLDKYEDTTTVKLESEPCSPSQQGRFHAKEIKLRIASEQYQRKSAKKKMEYLESSMFSLENGNGRFNPDNYKSKQIKGGSCRVQTVTESF
ncbi:uncharacterized protein LOC133183384 [Saccostrea echinata]|uniref:uncharacterized protein LOC133183384 n=1 Tax=Saccostrea echinata TaxID=191078 RepID=UPI002A800E98|nr:uncharacterized protein LOC133183384 [Saccostrea echinata]